MFTGEESRKESRIASKLRIVAKRMFSLACVSFSRKPVLVDPHIDSTLSMLGSGNSTSNQGRSKETSKAESINYSASTAKNLCAICLDPLSYNTSTSPWQPIFTGQCSHAFHFACISSNVRHGNVTCPICRAYWTQLPRSVNLPLCNPTDPILQILDDSIATFRVNRRSVMRSARYDDDEPIEVELAQNPVRLHLVFSLTPIPRNCPDVYGSCVHLCPSLHVPVHSLYHHHEFPQPYQLTGSLSLLSMAQAPDHFCPTNLTCLSVKLAHEQATDLVLIASPNGPHLRLLKQCIALLIFSLRSIDRLAIVTCSSTAPRIFPLRRMTSYGKRSALRVIDRLFYVGQAYPDEGLKKGVKILGDRAHKNPHSCILHLSDGPTRSNHVIVLIPIHRFHVGFGYGTSNGFVLHEFEEFLARMLRGVIREMQLKIGEDERIIKFGELSGGEERKIPLYLGDSRHVYIRYRYMESVLDDYITSGEALVSLGENSDGVEAKAIDSSIGGSTTSVGSYWDYHDLYLTGRWAKHLHAYKL